MVAPALTPRDALTVARIVKVNHAGEHGAIAIYGAQIAVAKRLFPELVPPLSEILSHELEHRANFRGAMPARHGARNVISLATDVLIWLSTWGDATRMARELAQASKGSPRTSRHARTERGGHVD